MTKPVTSVAAMILVDDGKLRLDDPVSKYVPEFKNQKVLVPGQDGAPDKLVDAEREVTVRDLLTHTSGLIYAFPGVDTNLTKKYAEAKINIQNITTSEIKISCIVSRQDGNKALQVVHDAFELEREPTTGAMFVARQ